MCMSKVEETFSKYVEFSELRLKHLEEKVFLLFFLFLFKKKIILGQS